MLTVNNPKAFMDIKMLYCRAGEKEMV